MLCPKDDAISILSFAENACGEGGREKFAVLETKRGIEVAKTGRFFEALQENLDRELPESIEYLNAKQSKHSVTMKRKQKLMRMEFLVTTRGSSSRTSGSWEKRFRWERAARGQ